MRRWAPLLLLSLSFGCAFAEIPNGDADVGLGPVGDYDSGFGDGSAFSSATPAGDEVAATLAPDNVDASADNAAETDATTVDAWVPPGAVPPFDSGEGGVCTRPLAPADLAID